MDKYILVAPHYPPVTGRLSEWRIVCTEDRVEVIGVCADSGKFRTSAPVWTIDTDVMVCRTNSNGDFQLAGSPAQDEIAYQQLARYNERFSCNAEDITEEILRDPEKRFSSFSLFNSDTGRIVSALPLFTWMACNPVVWLRNVSQALKEIGIDPVRHAKILRVSESDWQAYLHGELNVVSIDIAVRSRLLRDIFVLLFSVSGNWHNVSCGLNKKTAIPELQNRNVLEIIEEGDIKTLTATQNLLAGNILGAPYL